MADISQIFYYKVAFSGLNLEPLVYESYTTLEPFSVVLAPLRGKQTIGFVLKECEKPSFKTLKIEKRLSLSLTKIQIELFKFINYYYTSEIGVTLGLFELLNLKPSWQNFKFTSYKKAVKILNLEYKKYPNLNKIQQKAYEFITKNNTSLIFGDTGSGKSEVYIKTIAKILNEGGQALFLMPEISLTPQMQIRLESYFGKSVAIWHSKISQKAKLEILNSLANGSVKLVAGARSALFLPFLNLKLIVVDEEHDDSYKNSTSRPHYNARDLALFLGAKCNIKVVLGSATPSLNGFKKIPSFRMKGTFFSSEKSYIFDRSETGLSPLLKDEIAKSLANKKQAIICLPTRANFRFLSCKECGHTIKCPFCSIGMSFYKKQNMLKCQYCGYKTAVAKTCEECGSDMIEAKKLGTSELLEHLKSEFANARVAKFDRDEITTQSKLKKALKEFNNGDIDILVGTQMLSKGHDYHNVDLAVIMGVDEMFNYPDFRSRERTLSLVKQVAGRAGRNGKGRVVVQTYESEFFSEYINNYDKFLDDEYVARTGLYPPYTRLLRIVVSHKNDKTASEILLNLVKKIENLKVNENFEIIGYGKCAIEIMSAKFRYEILLRSNFHSSLISVSKACKGEFVDIDIDPLNFS